MLFLPSFTAISLSLLILILSSLVAHLHILPLLLRTFTQVRVSSFSFVSITGLEWRTKHEQEDIIPTLRIERAGWTWGGIKGDVTGLVVLRIEGISWRIKKNPSGDLKNEASSVKHRVSNRSISAAADYTTNIDAEKPIVSRPTVCFQEQAYHFYSPTSYSPLSFNYSTCVAPTCQLQDYL